MNAERLLAHYARITDAPDAIPRLRRFILDLAVRGTLVLQDPNDEPAQKLHDRLADIYAQTSEPHGRGKRSEVAAGLIEQPPYEVPNGWAWVRMGNLGDTNIGLTYSPSDVSESGVPVLRSNNVQAGRIDLSGLVRVSAVPKPSMMAGEGDMLICARNGSRSLVGKAAIIANLPEPMAFGTFIAIFRSPLNPYLHLFLASPVFRQVIDEVNTTTINQITQANLRFTLVPLPPLAEQHRIVAKVNELMTLCDRLESARVQREGTRDRLTAASLARLNAQDLDNLQDDARFVLDALPTLSTRSDQIKQLRQTILNLAVRGTLVPQDINDEPAEKLLRRIANEKARLIKVGDARSERVLPTISIAEMAFKLPTNWIWVRLGDLSKLVTSGSRDWAQHYSKDGAIFVRMGNLSKDHYRLRLDHIQRVTPPKNGEGTRTRLQAGDVLISITGDVGMLGLIPDDFGEAYINQHTAMVRPMAEMKSRYLAELFRSPFAQRQFNGPQRGIKNSFRLTDVTQFVVPLPPVAEQYRIVAKVDELMALCDRLESSLSTGDEMRRRLLEALLAEALAPSKDREVEAAE